MNTLKKKILTEQEVQNLMNYVNDIPTRYGMHIISFLNNKLIEENKFTEEDIEKEESPE